MYITGWTAALALAGAVPAMMLRSTVAPWIWVGCVVLLALLDALLAPRRRSVAVRRITPSSVRLTESTSTQVEIVNASQRRVRGAVRDAWTPYAGPVGNRHRFALGPGDVARRTTALTPRRRGDLKAAQVTVRLEGPLRLAGRQFSLDVSAVLRVLPEFASRKHLPSRLARLREMDGRSPLMMRGAGSEFDSLREYVIGDDVRTIDWRGTARRGDVVVRTFRPERDRRVVIVVDTSRLSAARVGDTPRLESSIEAALLLAALASHAGDRVQVLAYDRSERARAIGSSGVAAIPQVANALAPIEPSLVEPDWPGLVRAVRERVSQRALIVLLTTVDAAMVDGGGLAAVAALQDRHQVLVASVEDPEVAHMLTGRESADELYTAAAAARTLLERSVIESRLRQSGAEVLHAVPDEIAPATADAYLALKAAGRL